MADHPPINVEAAHLSEKLVYAFTIGFLNEEPIQDFVDRVRQREGIVPPENAEELAYNLEHHPPEQFEDEALEIAKGHFEDPSAADLGALDPTSVDLAEYVRHQPLMLTAPGFLEHCFEAVVPLADLRAQAASVLSRHIVTGYMEPPEPIRAFRLGGVSVGELDGCPVVCLLAGPGCDLEDLIAKFRATCREVFAEGGRQRGPDKAVQTGWQRAYAHYLRRHGEDETRVDLKVAEFSFEVWPETRPPYDPASPQYEAELRKRAAQFRANSANYATWIDEVFHPETRAQR